MRYYLKIPIIAMISISFCLFAMAEGTQEDGLFLEEKILKTADRDIEKYRKSDAVIKLIDKDGKAISDANIHIRQVASDFLFAANVTLIAGDLGGTIPIEHYRYQPRFKTQDEEDEFKRRFVEIFNCATLPLYWRAIEPVEDQPDYSGADRILEWCKSQGIVVKGHTLVWVHGDNVPQWFASRPVEEQRTLLEKHVRDVISRYKGKIDMWDAVNEAAWANRTLAGMTMIDYAGLPFLWAKESDPDAVLCINDAHKIVPLSEMERYWNLLVEMKAQNIPYDVIGIQAHIHREDRFPLDLVRDMLIKYSELGKPIHVTEFTPGSDGVPIKNSWKEGTWTEEEQADYTEKFYRLCFSIPAVESIGWWDLTDYSAWVTGGGILRADLSPKPVYYKLKNLIHKTWRTETEGKTDENGIFKFRGFHGKYEILIDDPDGAKIKDVIHIKKNEENEFSYNTH